MSNPATAAQGVLSKLWIISKSHGRGLVPVSDKFSANDKFGNQLISEMGTNYPILNTQTYEGGDWSFNIYETDLMLLYSMIYDIDPSVSTFAVRPENLLGCSFTLMGNQTNNATAKIFEGIVLEQCLITGMDASVDQKGNKQVSFKGTYTKAGHVKGGGVWYTRVVKSPLFATSDDVASTGSTATISKAAVSVPRPGLGSVYDTYLSAFLNGVKNDNITVSGTTVTATTAPSTGDWWDLLTVYSGS